ncbi:hypothetical protein L2E82_04831 [Cichorium intybus]|uniref:Uncharacterized protein n=1 Tax=Cichorium intybus TaxID=13427 RepID=A0ACB9H7E0_CICIN|nr:hypothetical protein L2E82_04831 [Cichorium intybus]
METEDRVFFPCVNDYEVKSSKVNSYEEIDDEEDERSRSSDENFSDDFSVREEEESFEESRVQETSPEMISNKNGGKEAVENSEIKSLNLGEKSYREGKILNNEIIENMKLGGEEKSCNNNGKILSPLPNNVNKSVSPTPLGCEANQDPVNEDKNLKEPIALDFKEDHTDEDKKAMVSRVSPQGEINSDRFKGVSDKLRNLLDRNTPIKNKIDRSDKEEKESRQEFQMGTGECDLEDFGGEMGFRAQEGNESQNNRHLFERRITRSQSRQFLKNEYRKIAKSQKVKSQDLKVGIEEDMDRLSEVGNVCGIQERKGSKKGTKRAKSTGAVICNK